MKASWRLICNCEYMLKGAFSKDCEYRCQNWKSLLGASAAAYLFPLGNWSWSINSRCLSDGRRSQRNFSKNFFLCESSLVLSELWLGLLKLGSRPWNSNLAREPITWFGGKNWRGVEIGPTIQFEWQSSLQLTERGPASLSAARGEKLKIVGWQVTRNKFQCCQLSFWAGGL